MTKFHPGTFTAGIIFLGLGFAFALEALGAWSFRLRHLGTLGPLVLIGIGIAVLAASVWRKSDQT